MMVLAVHIVCQCPSQCHVTGTGGDRQESSFSHDCVENLRKQNACFRTQDAGLPVERKQSVHGVRGDGRSTRRQACVAVTAAIACRQKDALRYVRLLVAGRMEHSFRRCRDAASGTECLFGHRISVHANQSTNETGANGHERASIFRAIGAD